MNRIAFLRKQKGISQTELGKQIGAAQNTVCNWENGNREPDKETYIKLAEFFEVSVSEIMGVDTEELPEELIILNRAAKRMTDEKRKLLLDMARTMFKEEFNDWISGL